MVLSLNESIDEDEDLTLGDKIADKNTPEKELDKQHSKKEDEEFAETAYDTTETVFEIW